MSIKSLETALDARLRNDATLGALVGQGLWNMQRPDVAFGAGDQAWVMYRCQAGGDTNDRPGRWKDVLMLIGGHCAAQEGAVRALDIDARIEALVHGWTPTLSGWPEVWAAQRERSIQATVSDEAAVLEYSAGALYRFRFGTPTPPVPPATAQSPATEDSGDKPLVEVIYDRLQRDATLVALAGAGVWFGALPGFSEVLEVELVGGEPAYGDVKLENPTWVELIATRGGPTNDATGPMFRDVELFVRGRSFEHAGAAIDVDDWVDRLLVNWQPPVDGYAEWKITRVEDRRRGYRVPIVDRLVWEAGGTYRLRLERSV